ncbi:MAG: N-acetyltransferase family protein [Acidobacteriota bacterium]
MENLIYKAEAMEDRDWPAVEAIYVDGIATGNATFEATSPGWERWNASHLPFGRLVVRDGSDILGWSAVSPVSSRCVYAGVAEVSVYVTESARGKGIGRILLEALISECEKNGIWTLQAGILTENQASLALHRTCGFRDVGYRERLGKLGDQWRDVALLERRSDTVGLE